jgi:hypothetical protein
MAAKPVRREDGKVLIYTPYVTRGGVRDWAWKHGLKAWAIWVDPNRLKPSQDPPPSGHK